MHGSDPSGGVSAFRGGASTDGTGDMGIPNDKFIVGNESASEILQSNSMSGVPQRAYSGVGNEDIQGMYDRVMGATNSSGMPMADRSSFMQEQ